MLPMCREGAFLGGSVVKNPPAMPKTGVQSLGWEDPLEKKMATHSSILAWEIPRTEELGPLTQCLSQASVKVSERLQSPEDLTTEEPSSQLTCMVVRAWQAAGVRAVNDKLALAKGICHLPLWALNPVLLQLLTFDRP